MQTDPIIDSIKRGISSVESGGSYSAIGPATKTGDKAYGKYQVMGANIPAWTKEATGTASTPDQFLSDPNIQEAVASHKIGQYYGQYGNPSDVASAWFTGGPLKSGSGKQDITGTKTDDYVSKVLKNMGNTSNTPGSSAAPIGASGFAAKIKAKYPQYQGLSDDDLTQKILAKYPQYQSTVYGGTKTDSSGFNPDPFSNTTPGDPLASLSKQKPITDIGTDLYKGVGYALSNALGTQDNLIKAQDEGSRIETQLIQRIRQDRAQGKDTSRLQSALSSLGTSQQNAGNAATDVGTGGLSSGDILKSGAFSAVAIPAAIGAGGLVGNAISNAAAGGAELRAPSVVQALENYALGEGESASALSNTDKLNALGNALKNPDIPLGEETEIKAAIKKLAPSGDPGIMSKIISESKKYALYKMLGDTAGSLIHKVTGS